jgi:hypothetical protein
MQHEGFPFLTYRRKGVDHLTAKSTPRDRARSLAELG